MNVKAHNFVRVKIQPQPLPSRRQVELSALLIAEAMTIPHLRVNVNQWNLNEPKAHENPWKN
ncbi:unnamed protein product [Ceratitis capitata]|uniref:(Mediterranean fruit fly) hypothetical protein n=1 Tax=Ceratitis capitata TaxID=7213 RepID=A0A811U3B2_CERCA|nr:unnamed protein product [Ceratitis capitata]